MTRAVGAYLAAMFDDTTEASTRAEVKGIPASPGTRVGTARVVLGPQDFARVEAGDVLVTRVTSPAYNVLMPLLAGVVTDRGGVLSHPAIVSREFGIPGVVGTRKATELIPDGARVEIDGTLGTVKVLS
jgi:pyruvate,water dikinase